MHEARISALAALLLVASTAAAANAQARKLRVVASNEQPVVYALVTIEGGNGQITDEHGEISLGAGKRKTLSVTVRRIGYRPWAGKIELPDTAAVLTVTLAPLAQSLDEVRVTDSSGVGRIGLKLQGFYDRWLMRQKGLLSATFIGPEELEFRHPDKITNVLYGLNGVTIGHTSRGQAVIDGYAGMCPMAVVVDGITQCPPLGCKCASCGANMPDIASRGAGTNRSDPDGNKVVIDQILEANDVTAIEVYPRGANMPVSLQVSDPGCGVVAFWTGSRKP